MIGKHTGTDDLQRAPARLALTLFDHASVSETNLKQSEALGGREAVRPELSDVPSVYMEIDEEEAPNILGRKTRTMTQGRRDRMAGRRDRVSVGREMTGV